MKKYTLTWIYTDWEGEFEDWGKTLEFATRKQRRNYARKYGGGGFGKWLKGTTTSTSRFLVE
jgi:hypothetical protein